MKKITMLFDNISKNKSLKQGHGLSIYIEFNNLKLLMDTGANKKLIENAGTLNIDLYNLDGIIISHSHSDHTGGLNYLELSKQTIFSSDNVLSPKYLKVLGFNKYIGISKNINTTNFQFISELTEIYPDVFIIPLKNTSKTTPNLYKSDGNNKVLDDFADELALVLLHNDTLTIFTGCSHHGIIDIIHIVQSYFPTKHVKNVIGGFHMIGIPYINNLGMKKIEIEKVGNELNNIDVEHFYTCHCTGMKAYNLLKPILKEKLSYLSTGESLHFN